VGDNVGKTGRRLVNNTWECLQKAIQEGELKRGESLMEGGVVG
jgi:hypothetical protein